MLEDSLISQLDQLCEALLVSSPEEQYIVVFNIFPFGSNFSCSAVESSGHIRSVDFRIGIDLFQLLVRHHEVDTCVPKTKWNKLTYSKHPSQRGSLSKEWDDRPDLSRRGKLNDYNPLDKDKLTKPWRWELSPIELHNQLVKSLARRAFNYMPLNAKWKELRMTISMDGTECTLQPEYTDHKGHVIAYEVELSDRMRWDIEDLHALSAGDKPFLAPWKKAVLTVMPDESFDIQYS